MMPFKLLRDGMAESAVIADGAIIPLILQGLNNVTLTSVFIHCRIQGMGAAMAGLTHHDPHQILAVAEQLLSRAGPGIESVH